MPRVHVRKTSRGQIDLSRYKNAYDEVKAGNSLRNAAKRNGVNYASLSRYIRKRDTSAEGENQVMGYSAHNRVFSEEQEREFLKYLLLCIDIHFGLTKNVARKLAYEFTIKYNLSRPRTWDNNKMAGEEWFRMFTRRNTELSILTAKTTNFSRDTSLNKNNIDSFYDYFNTVIKRYEFEPQDIYSIMETGITTLKSSDRMVRRAACKVGIKTSAEKDTFISVAFAANVIGNVIPPFFVFPQVLYQEHFLRDGPIGSAGTANPSGWLHGESFMHFLKHFKKFSKVSHSQKALLVLENQSTYIHIKTLDYCKDNGIVLLSFPPRFLHRYQPFDETVFDPLKKAVNLSCDVWMLNHPGKTMEIYDIPRIVASATLLAFTPLKIQAGFRKTGIQPYNQHMTTVFDFASVTNSSNQENKSEEEIILELNIQPNDEKLPLSRLNNSPKVKIEEENFDEALNENT